MGVFCAVVLAEVAMHLLPPLVPERWYEAARDLPCALPVLIVIACDGAAAVCDAVVAACISAAAAIASEGGTPVSA